jgi:hypothetical protein
VRHLMRTAVVITIALLTAACATTPPPSGTQPPPPSPPASSAAPDLRSSTVDFSQFGPFRIGMTIDEVRTANAGVLQESSLAYSCISFTDPASTTGMADSLQLLVTLDNGGRLVGIRTPIVARTGKGIGIGSSRAQVEMAYAGLPVTNTESQVGTMFLVQNPGTSDYIGFVIDHDSVSSTLVGTRDFAAGYELCSG